MHRKILHIAIPSIISNITVPLLGLVDVGITGHLGKTSYIGAIALGSLFFNILYWNFGFLRMGTSGLTAQGYGKKSEEEIVRILIQAVSVALTAAFFIIILQYPLQRLAFSILDTTQEIELYAVTYIRILIWGAPAILLLYVFYGWFIGMQNSLYQMYVAVSMNLINILLSFIFVYRFGMKIEGVAYSTLVAQYSGVFLALILWTKKYGYLRKLIKLRENLRIKEMKLFFIINRDIFLRTLCLIAVTSFFTYAGAKQGEVTLAVNTLLMQLFTLFSYFMDGFAYAGEALVGRYTGARNVKQIKKVIKSLFQWGISLALFFSILYTIAGKEFLHIMTNDSLVIEAASGYFCWVLAIPIAGFAAFIWDGVYIGASLTRYMLFGVSIAALAFFGVIYLYSGISNNQVLWLAFIIYLFLRGLVQTFFAKKIVSKIE